MKSKPMSRRLVATVLAAAFAGAVVGVPAQAQTAPRKPFRVVTTFTVIQDIAQNVAGDSGDRGIDHQAGRRDPRLPADAARHREGAGGRPRAVERLQPRTLVREVLRERQGRAERRRHRRHRADGHRRGPLHRQAQSACLDVAGQRADLCREHPQGAGRNTIRPMPRPTPSNAAAYSAQIKALDEPLAQAARRHSRRTSAGWSRARAPSAIWRATTACAKLYLWPINADEQGTPQQVRKVIDLVRKNKIPVVFSESTISDKRRQAGRRARPARATAACSMSTRSAPPDGPVPTYLDLLEGDGRDHRQGIRQVNASAPSAGVAPAAGRDAAAPAFRCAT